MNLSNTEVHVWHINIDTQSDADAISLLKSYLSEDELMRANRFANLDLQIHFILARGYLRAILSKYVEETPGELSISYGKYGKPFLKNKNIEFSFTHSKSLCLLALTMNQKVGIDVEQIGCVRDWHKIMRYCLSDNEQQELFSYSEEEQEEAFLRGWTRKEAYTKAIGKGLLYNFSSFSVMLRELGAEVLDDYKNEKNLSNWTIMNVDVEKPYVAALSVNKKDMHKLEFHL